MHNPFPISTTYKKERKKRKREGGRRERERKKEIIGIVADFEKSCRESTENPVHPVPNPPTVNSLLFDGALAKTKTLRLVNYY